MLNSVKDFFHQFPQKRYHAGEVILGPVKTIDSIFYVEEGDVRMYAVSPDGKESIIRMFEKNLYFPMALVLYPFPQIYYFEASNDVTIYKAPVKEIIEFIKKNPPVMEELLVHFAKTINGMSIRIEHLISKSSYTKLASFLLYLVQKYGVENEKGKYISHKISHDDLGSWLGLARETVSRQMEVLEDKNIIRYVDSYIEVADLERLRQEAQEEVI